MSALAEAPSRNGDGPKLDVERYRTAVKARMRKYDATGRRIVPDDDEVDRFMFEASFYGLEPLADQIYASWVDGAMKAVTPIDGLRILAERSKRYDGQNDPEWCDKEGNWTDFWPGGSTPLAARVRVHKKGTEVPTTGTANWCDFAPQGQVEEGSQWSVTGGRPAHILSIRAEALALRKAFPSELSGLYAAEELGISLAAIGAGDEEPSSKAVAADVPADPSASRPGNAGPSPSPAPPPSPVGSAEVPAGIVDAAAEQPSGAPARPQAKRTLAEALASSDFERLRRELTEALFDQMPDRLTDEQSEILAATLAEAEGAGITPVELERACKVALNEGKGNVDARSEALLKWISERLRKAEDEAESVVSAQSVEAPEVQAESQPTAASESPSLLDADPGPEERA
jgi:hypothetical protein